MITAGCVSVTACQTMPRCDPLGPEGIGSLWDSGGALAVAEVGPTQGDPVSGKVQFKRNSGSVRVTVDLVGLAPSSEHGFRVHGGATLPRPTR